MKVPPVMQLLVLIVKTNVAPYVATTNLHTKVPNKNDKVSFPLIKFKLTGIKECQGQLTSCLDSFGVYCGFKKRVNFRLTSNYVQLG